MVIDSNGCIGMLDSGVGGLAVAREVLRALPAERLIYVGDTAHFPYGTRTAGEVVSHVRDILDFFRDAGVKAAVLACNTASAVALPVLRDRYPFQVVGVIDAGARMAATSTRNGCIGVLATERTVQSGAYGEAVRRLRPELRVLGQAAPALVTMVEEGYGEKDPAALDAAIAEHVRPLIEAGADTVILGCTHFLALGGRIRQLFPGIGAVIDPAAETARQVADLLAERGLLQEPSRGTNGLPRCRFLISGHDADHFRLVGSRILGREIGAVEPFPARALAGRVQGLLDGSILDEE